MKKLKYYYVLLKDRRQEMKANTLESLSLLNMQTSLIIIGILICIGVLLILFLKNRYLKIASVALLLMFIINLWRFGKAGLKK